MKYFLWTALLSFQGHAQIHSNLSPFTTDYCTAYAEGTPSRPQLWKHCCLEHDLYFWAGGSLEDRKKTDLRLKSCVEKTGEIAQARLIYTAVTIGSSSPIRFSTKQWGNAWKERIRYLSLTEKETGTILQYIETYAELSSEIKQNFKEQLNGRLDIKL